MGQRHSSQSYHICKGCIFFILPCQHSIMNLQQYILLPWDSLTFCNKLSPLSAADVSAHSLVTLSYVDKLLQQITGVSKLLRQFVTSIVTFQLSTRLSENFPSLFFLKCKLSARKKVTQSPSSMKSGCTYFTLLNFGKRPLANGLIKLCFECEYLKL